MTQKDADALVDKAIAVSRCEGEDEIATNKMIMALLQTACALAQDAYSECPPRSDDEKAFDVVANLLLGVVGAAGCTFAMFTGLPIAFVREEKDQ